MSSGATKEPDLHHYMSRHQPFGQTLRGGISLAQTKHWAGDGAVLTTFKSQGYLTSGGCGWKVQIACQIMSKSMIPTTPSDVQLEPDVSSLQGRDTCAWFRKRIPGTSFVVIDNVFP
jgi:hypothetical protein